MNNIIISREWLESSPVVPDNLLGQAFTGEIGAHTFIISGVNAAGEPVAITGSITATFLAPNGVTVPLTGAVDDGKAVVTLTQDCYVYPGRFILTVFAENNGTRICIYCGVGNVFRTSSDMVGYPSAALPDVAQLIEDLQYAIDSFPADLSGLLMAIAPSFNKNTAYTAGQYVWYYGGFYRFTSDHPAGNWNPGHVTDVHLANDVTAINNKIGDSTMGTTATTVTGAIAEHEGDISGLGSSVTSINTQIGSTPMGTEATTITGAIKEHTDSLGDLKSAVIGDTYNLYHCINKTKKINNVDITTTIDNHVTATGTANANGGRTNLDFGKATLPSGTYYFSVANMSSGTHVSLMLSDSSTNVISFANASFTLADETDVYLVFNVVKNSVYSFSCDIQITQGSSAKEFIRPLTAVDLLARKDINNIYDKIDRKIIVDKSGGGDYTSLSAAIQYAYTQGDYTLYVKAGTYDIFDELDFSDKTALPGYGEGNNNAWGLKIGNNMHIICEDGVVFSGLYTGDSLDFDIKTRFSMLNVTGNYTIENMEIVIENLRYCIHEDTMSLSLNSSYISKIINCRMRHKGGYTTSACLGCGDANNSLTIIQGGEYKSDDYDYPISMHNHTGNKDGRIIVDGVYFANGTVRLAGFSSTEAGDTLHAVVRNCRLCDEIFIDDEPTKIDLIEFGNVIAD